MKIIANLDRRLVTAGEQSQRYLRVRVQAPEAESRSAKRLPLNLALVIDRSGSMSGTKLEKAKEAAIHCLRSLTGTDRAAIITYDDEVRVVSPSRALTPETKNQLVQEVKNIGSGGSTNLGGGWLTGAGEVAKYAHEANYLTRVILFSDGLANVGIVDNEELFRHATELRQRGVSTTTMGIGADFNEELLEGMAVKGGGHFYYIEEARQIPDFLHRELGEVLATWARQVTLELRVPDGITANLLNSFEVTHDGSRLQARLDDVIAGETRTLVFKLAISAGSGGTALPLPLKLAYRHVETGETRTAMSSEALLARAPAAEVAAEMPDGSVLEDAALLEAALARDEALRADAAGDYATSAARLASASHYLRQMAPASPAAQQEALTLEGEVATAAGGFTSRKRKEMHYDQNTRRQSREK